MVAELGLAALVAAGAVFAAAAHARAGARERAARFAAACARLESMTAPRDALAELGAASGWPLGLYFALDRAAGSWRCVELWRDPAFPRTRFEMVAREGTWPARPDAEAAKALAAEGLPAAACSPVRSGGEVTGVLALFGRADSAGGEGVVGLVAAAAATLTRAAIEQGVAARAAADDAARKAADDALRDRDRDHAALRGTTALQRALFENGSWAMFTTDAAGVITSFNAAAEKWSGYPAAQVVGSATPVILHDGEEVAARARELAKAGGAAVEPGVDVLVARAREGLAEEREWTWVRKNGQRFPVSVSFNPLRDSDGHVTGYLGIARDLTERNRVRQELTDAKDAAERASRAKSEFLANMSHELRTPLNSIIGFANILLKNKDEHLNAKELTYLGRVLENGKHLLGLINTILDLSKIEAGKSELSIGPVAMDQLAREVIAQFEAQTHDREITLSAEIPDELAPIEADETKLRQVLINLVGNALKFTHQGSVTVRIAADPVNRRPLAVEVADTGIGIPPDRQQAVFDAFQQVDNTTARQYGGTGLGLTITKTLLQQMSYGIELESEVGKGSTFRVRLWKQPEGVPQIEVMSPEDARKLRVAEKLVLIIDDDADSRMLMHRIVQDVGCRVVSAPSGAWGLELARLNQPDIVLLDLMMPRMDGRDVATRLREDANLRDIPVIVVTIDADKAKGSVPDVEDYVSKPIEPEALKVALKRHLFPKRGKILVVDDDQFVTEVLSYALQEKGAEVRTAENGKVALDTLREYRPDLIILDLMMPVMGGMAFLEQFQQHPRFSSTPIFVLTGKILTPQEIADLEKIGARVMIKGEKLDVLLREVFSRLPERRRRDRPKKTVVRVQPKLAHLIPGFLKNRANDVEAIRAAIATGDFPVIQRLGHQLRGAGGGYGFTDLTDIGHRLEVAAIAMDAEELGRSLGALSQYLDSVEVIYQ